ncbi:hypothetical protein HZS_5014 [Henneguya salminicola]|nr:hypothetical protein HZS_5014 [Henneguya salminicola]
MNDSSSASTKYTYIINVGKYANPLDTSNGPSPDAPICFLGSEDDGKISNYNFVISSDIIFVTSSDLKHVLGSIIVCIADEDGGVQYMSTA